MTLGDTRPSEISQSQKDKYYRSPLTRGRAASFPETAEQVLARSWEWGAGYLTVWSLGSELNRALWVFVVMVT